MKNHFIFLILLILFSSFRIKTNGPWVESRKDNIILFTRPPKFSSSPSPDSLDIIKILKGQTENYSYINKYLRTSFKSNVKIFLFNYDEAKQEIGTNSGGGANTKIKELYFAFNKDLAEKMDDFIGIHELAHIIASNEFKHPATRLINEGYSNAISNGYKIQLSDNGLIIRTTLERWMSDYVKSDKILTPSEMLSDVDKISNDLYYPQAGYFIKWLINQYGIETTNAIYSLKSKQIKNKLFLLTGKDFSIIEQEYVLHLEIFK